MWEVIQNRRVIFGAGKIREIKKINTIICSKKVFILPYSLNSKVIENVLEDLKNSGIKYYLSNPVQGEPDLHIIDRCVEKLHEEECDCVLAIGGGSTLDSAKAIAMIATNGGTIEQYQMFGKQIEKPSLPLVVVPTTAGTGSEATKVSVIYNNNNHLKKSIYSPYMIADTVILDPETTIGLHDKITASTGIDALSHAIESYVSLDSTPYTEIFSLKAIELIVKSLAVAVGNGKNLKAREDMLLASYFAGCALNAGIGLAHIIAQPIGGLLKIPHGEACSIFLPYSMEYNVEYSLEKYCKIARLFGVNSPDISIKVANEGIQKVKELIQLVATPIDIKKYIDPANFNLDEAVETIQGATSHIKCNPRPVDREIIKETLKRVI